MRRVGLAVCCAIALSAGSPRAAPRSSNPAFLGIRMQSVGSLGACMIDAATPDGPAEAAGLQSRDLVLAIDGKPVADCNALLDEITAHVPGDAVRIKLQRLGTVVEAVVQLTTRDGLLRKVIGKPMVQTNFVGVSDGTIYDLSSLHGRVALVGLYNPACVDCASVFPRLVAWARGWARTRGGPEALVLAVRAGEAPHDTAALQRALDVPLATGEFVAPGSPFSRELVISDPERLGVILIDGRGIVQYVGPIAPGSEDAQAMFDELFAAAEQAARWSR